MAQAKIQTEVLGHSLVYTLVCSHRFPCFGGALRCAHLFACSLTLLTPLFVGLDGYLFCFFFILDRSERGLKLHATFIGLLFPLFYVYMFLFLVSLLLLLILMSHFDHPQFQTWIMSSQSITKICTSKYTMCALRFKIIFNLTLFMMSFIVLMFLKSNWE